MGTLEDVLKRAEEISNSRSKKSTSTTLEQVLKRAEEIKSGNRYPKEEEETPIVIGSLPRTPAHNNAQRKADRQQRLSADPVSSLVLPTATQPAVLPRFAPALQQTNARYVQELQGMASRPEVILSQTKKEVDSLNVQIEEAERVAKAAQKRATALQRAAVPGEELRAAQVANTEAQKTLKTLTARRDMLANQYYAAENESTLQKMQGDAGFAKAAQLQAELNTLQDLINQRSDMSEEARTAFVQGLAERYGTSNSGKLAQAIMAELETYKAQVNAQGVDFERVAEYMRRQKTAQRAAEKREERAQAAREHPVATSAQSVLASPFQGIDMLKMLGTGSGSVKNLDSYVPYDANVMTITDAVNTIRGAVSEEIEKNTDWEIAGQNVASFLYNTGMSIGDSALQVAAFGPAATYLMGMSAAANQSKNIIERGGTNQQALWGGLAAGAAEAVFEKISIDNLLSKKNITGVKSFIVETLKQAGVEASEEMSTEIANILTDAVIMGERSEFKESVRGYMQQGMTAQQAKQRALLDAIGQVAASGIGGALSGGVMGGGVSAFNAIPEITRKAQNAPTVQLNARESVSDVPSGTTTTPDSTPAELNAEPQASFPEGLGAMSSGNPTSANLSKVGTNTLTNTPYLTAEQKQRYKPETLTYESTTNAKDMLTASERLAVDYDGEAEAIAQNGIQNSEDLHVAFALMFDAVQNDGETGTSARQWMEKLAEAGSKSGQVVQAFSVYAHTPQGKLVQAQRVVDAINSGETPKAESNPILDAIDQIASQGSKAKTAEAHKSRKANADATAEEITTNISSAPTGTSRKRKQLHTKAAKSVSSSIVKGNTVAEMWSDQMSDALSTRNGNKNAPPTIARIILNDLRNFAAANVTYEQAAKAKGRTAEERINDYLANTPFYDEVWQTAKRKIREQYADNPEALAEFDRYLNHSLRESVLNTVYESEHVARLSDNEIAEIFELMQKSNSAEPGSYEANMYEAKANKIIASKLPRTIRSKIVSALMDNMLGNIRTLLTRNAGGNLLFAIPEQVSKGFATGIDTLVGKATGERSYTVTPSYYKEYAKGLAKGVSDAVKDLRNDVKTPRSGETLEYTAQFSPFATPVFRGIDRGVQFGLDLSDRPFYEANYAARMAELERIKSKNKLSPEFAANFDALAPLEAQAFALDAVFQSKNAASQGLSNLRLGIQGLIQAASGISLGGQLAMPFTRTGGGILQRTLDYLPGVGTAKNAVTTIGELASKNRTFDQTRFSMESGRNLTGLAATAGLAALVGAGALTGGFYGDDDEKTKEQAGQQEYSVKIGNAYYGYDWIPVLGALGGATADAIEAFDNAGENDNAIVAAISAGAKTAAELTAVQGLNRMFGGYSSTPQALAKTMLESTSQISPTVVRQIAGATDKYERQTYDPNIVIQQWNKIRAAWPVLRQTLPVLYDLYGQPVEKNQGRSVVSNLAEDMIAPNNFSTVQTDPRTNILLEIAAEGYGTDPTATPKEVKDMRLTAKEYNQFSKTSGTTFGDLMTLWTEDPNFSGLPTSLKSAVVDEAQEFAADKAKREFVTGRGKEYDNKWNDENELPKNVLAEVLIYDNALRTATGENATPESYTAMDALLDAAGGMNKQALAVMHEKDLFTRLLEANAAGMTTEQFVNASNGIDKLGQDADFYEKARVIANNDALGTDQKWHMLYDAKNAQSGDKDKVNTAKSLGIPLNDYTTALVLIGQAGATSSKDVVSILNGLGMDNATKSKLYAVFTTTKAKGNGNPYGNDYSDTIRWKYVP